MCTLCKNRILSLSLLFGVFLPLLLNFSNPTIIFFHSLFSLLSCLGFSQLNSPFMESLTLYKGFKGFTPYFIIYPQIWTKMRFPIPSKMNHFLRVNFRTMKPYPQIWTKYGINSGKPHFSLLLFNSPKPIFINVIGVIP